MYQVVPVGFVEQQGVYRIIQRIEKAERERTAGGRIVFILPERHMDGADGDGVTFAIEIERVGGENVGIQCYAGNGVVYRRQVRPFLKRFQPEVPYKFASS